MKQWPFLLIIFLSLPHIAFSHEIKLSEFDQSHLSALISRLPTVLIYTHTEKINFRYSKTRYFQGFKDSNIT
jgi:hypothetical protein